MCPLKIYNGRSHIVSVYMGESISTERVISENKGLEFFLQVVSTLEHHYNAALWVNDQGLWCKQSDSYTAVYFVIFFCDSDQPSYNMALSIPYWHRFR